MVLKCSLYLLALFCLLSLTLLHVTNEKSDSDSGSDSDTRKRKVPYILLHGFTGTAESMINLQRNLTGEGYDVMSLKCFEGAKSLQNVHRILLRVMLEIRYIQTRFPAFRHGYHLVGHSLGGLLVRAVAQFMHDHRIVHLYSLAGVQNGVFYDEKDIASILGANIYSIPSWAHNLILRGAAQYATVLSKARLFKSVFGGAQLWHTPLDRYYRSNDLLPVMNNVHPNEEKFLRNAYFRKVHIPPEERKRHLCRVKKAFFFYSEADQVIRPPQSAIFGFYRHQRRLKHVGEILPMEMSDSYIQDTFGLRTLSETNRLRFIHVPNTPHCCWLRSIDECDHEQLYDEHMYELLTEGQKG